MKIGQLGDASGAQGVIKMDGVQRLFILSSATRRHFLRHVGRVAHAVSASPCYGSTSPGLAYPTLTRTWSLLLAHTRTQTRISHLTSVTQQFERKHARVVAMKINFYGNLN